MRRRIIALTAVIALLATQVSAVAAKKPDAGPVIPDATGEPHAFLHGKEIPISEVRHYFCHDMAFPRIQCFDSRDESLRDQGRNGELDMPDAPNVGPEDVRIGSDSDFSALSAESQVAAAGCCIILAASWFEHSYYGGGAMDLYYNYANLHSIGWGDAISSFKTWNSYQPKWYFNTNYSGGYVYWSVNAWVAYVGSAYNDTFSSVKKI